MKQNNNFEYDLEIGIKGENFVAKALSNVKIEVKTDFKAKDTGNVFVEYESRNKLSGISKTKSKWYCFVISNNNLIFISVTKLKKLCRKYLNTNRDVKGGDNNTSKGILLPLEDLTKL